MTTPMTEVMTEVMPPMTATSDSFASLAEATTTTATATAVGRNNFSASPAIVAKNSNNKSNCGSSGGSSQPSNAATKKSKANSKKANSSENSKNNNPRRPLNAYNFFFSYMRVRFLQLSNATENDGASSQQLLPVPSNLAASDIRSALESGPCLIGSQGRRRHRKSHGKISFRELTQIVSSGWNTLSSDTKRAFQEVAAEHRAKHFIPGEEEAVYKGRMRANKDRKRKEATTAAEVAETIDNEQEGMKKKKPRRKSAPVVTINRSTANSSSQAVAIATANDNDISEAFHGRSISRRCSAPPAPAAVTSASCLLSDQERQHLLDIFLEKEGENTAAEDPYENLHNLDELNNDESNSILDELFSAIEPLPISAAAGLEQQSEGRSNNEMEVVSDLSLYSSLPPLPAMLAPTLTPAPMQMELQQVESSATPALPMMRSVNNEFCLNCQHHLPAGGSASNTTAHDSAGAYIMPPLSPSSNTVAATAATNEPLLLQQQLQQIHSASIWPQPAPSSSSSFIIAPPSMTKAKIPKSKNTDSSNETLSYTATPLFVDKFSCGMMEEKDKLWLESISSPQMPFLQHDDKAGLVEEEEEDIVDALCRMNDDDKQTHGWLELVANALEEVRSG